MFGMTTWAAPVFIPQEVVLGIRILLLLLTGDSHTHISEDTDPQL